MLVQNKISKKLGLAYKVNNFISVSYRDGSKIYYSEDKFKQNFKEFINEEFVLVHVVNNAYFTNKLDADWQENFLKKHGYEFNRSFIYDTSKNILERINNVQS